MASYVRKINDLVLLRQIRDGVKQKDIAKGMNVSEAAISKRIQVLLKKLPYSPYDYIQNTMKHRVPKKKTTTVESLPVNRCEICGHTAQANNASRIVVHTACKELIGGIAPAYEEVIGGLKKQLADTQENFQRSKEIIDELRAKLELSKRTNTKLARSCTLQEEQLHASNQQLKHNKDRFDSYKVTISNLHAEIDRLKGKIHEEGYEAQTRRELKKWNAKNELTIKRLQDKAHYLIDQLDKGRQDRRLERSKDYRTITKLARHKRILKNIIHSQQARKSCRLGEDELVARIIRGGEVREWCQRKLIF